MTRIARLVRSQFAHRQGDVGVLSMALLPLMVAASMVAYFLSPGPGRACSGEIPTFDYVVNTASAIARVTVLEGRDEDRSETFRVDKVLKGRLPDMVVLEPARSHICGDTVSFFLGAEGANVGQSAILAIDVRFYDQVIHPVWFVIKNRLGGSADLPVGVSTLLELERATAAAVSALPATDVGDAAGRRDSGPSMSTALVATVALGLFVALLWFRRARITEG